MNRILIDSRKIFIKNIPGEPEKSSHVLKFIASTVLHRFEWCKSYVKAKRLKYF